MRDRMESVLDDQITRGTNRTPHEGGGEEWASGTSTLIYCRIMLKSSQTNFHPIALPPID